MIQIEGYLIGGKDQADTYGTTERYGLLSLFADKRGATAFSEKEKIDQATEIKKVRITIEELK